MSALEALFWVLLGLIVIVALAAAFDVIHHARVRRREKKEGGPTRG
jgi:uncharacterized membrane protein